MYDLRIGDLAAPEIAIECTGAVDAIATETWNLGPARGPLSCDLKGNWSVTLLPNARINAIREHIGFLLKECERKNLVDFIPVDWHLQRKDNAIFGRLQRLKVDSIHRYQAEGEGKVHLGMTGIGGAVDKTGRHVPQWIGDFLRAPERSDVLTKLLSSNARDCHVFVPVSFGGAPWPVESYLGSAIEVLPQADPDLPIPVTGVWIVYASIGVRWERGRWSLFEAQLPDPGGDKH